MTRATQTVHTAWLIILAFVGQAAVWIAVLSQYGDSREIDGACLRSVPDNAVMTGEMPRFEADVTFLPIGRACVYDATTGGTITVQTGQTVTLVAVAGTVVCLIAVVIAWSRWRRSTPMHRLLAGVALLFLVLGWLVIWLHAAMR